LSHGHVKHYVHIFLTGATLAEFTTFRSIDAKAMCDLASYNYIEVTIIVDIVFFFA